MGASWGDESSGEVKVTLVPFGGVGLDVDAKGAAAFESVGVDEVAVVVSIALESG